jgi:hypothetical protein
MTAPLLVTSLQGAMEYVRGLCVVYVSLLVARCSFDYHLFARMWIVVCLFYCHKIYIQGLSHS